MAIGSTSYLYLGLPKYGNIPQYSLLLSVNGMSTQLATSHSELPKMLTTLLFKGMEVFLLKILVFSNLKSTTGHLSLASLQVISTTGDV